MSKLRGECPSPPVSLAPPSPSRRAPSRLCLSSVIPSWRNLTCHWLASHLQAAKQGEVKGAEAAPLPGLVSLVAYGPKVSLLSFSHGELVSETRQRGSQHCCKENNPCGCPCFDAMFDINHQQWGTHPSSHGMVPMGCHCSIIDWPTLSLLLEIIHF